MQVQQLEERLRYLKEEKDIAQRDYQTKINGQEQEIDMTRKELDELQRINGNKDGDNRDIKGKLTNNKDKLVHSDSDYSLLRDQNDIILKQNKAIKDEIAMLEDQITDEKKRQLEQRAIKDKLSHSLYRGADQSSHLLEKEEELVNRLREKELEQQIKEDKLRQLERENIDKDQKLSHVKTQVAQEDSRLTNIQTQIQHQITENDRCLELGMRFKDQHLMEEVKAKELYTRSREINDKIARRDAEIDLIVVDHKNYQRDNQLLKEKLEVLMQERDALRRHTEKVAQANKAIEEELDSFVSLDDSIVKTLEKRDHNLSPIVSQYNPRGSQLPNAATMQTQSFGVQSSRMFDLQSAEQAKISTYRPAVLHSQAAHQIQYPQPQLQNQLYMSHARLPELQAQDLYKSQTAYKYDNLSNDDLRRTSAGETHNFASSYGRESHALRFLNPRSLNGGPILQNESSKGNLHQSQVAPPNQLSITHLGGSSYHAQNYQPSYNRKEHSPLRSNF
ncbi:UNKNOWN [Stylonychia lemnae]|uniref:Uncharacterized protein n=1 Tax=Stylonychia lemnae TaxID=5949 RepID=A0A078BBM8_STYLE|nr:UNKNOWN [Stylonychia lemnae]|eukprot:CDW91616.1 UNKNOWN [Stylonychia lemnae]